MQAWAEEQGWKPGTNGDASDLRPVPGEVTVDKALDTCRDFFKKAGLAFPSDAPTVNRFTSTPKRGGVFAFFFAGQATISVSATTGEVTMFSNLSRDFDSPASHSPQGRPLLTNDISARAYLQGLARRFGLGTDVGVVELVSHYPGEPTASRPSIKATFQPMPYGYRLRWNWGSRDIAVDPWDGVMLSYGIRPGVRIKVDSHEAKISISDAQAKAAPVVSKYKIGQIRNAAYANRAKPATITQSSGLMYVVPNGLLDGLKYESYEEPYRMRLAWVLFYAYDEEVWIDAADGRVLGGMLYDPGPKRKKARS